MNVKGIIRKRNKTLCWMKMKQVGLALCMYKMDEGEFPNELKEVLNYCRCKKFTCPESKKDYEYFEKSENILFCKKHNQHLMTDGKIAL